MKKLKEILSNSFPKLTKLSKILLQNATSILGETKRQKAKQIVYHSPNLTLPDNQMLQQRFSVLYKKSLVKFKKSTFNQINLSTIQDWMTINLAIRPTRQSRWTQAFTYIVFHLHGKAKKCHTTMSLVLI